MDHARTEGVPNVPACEKWGVFWSGTCSRWWVVVVVGTTRRSLDDSGESDVIRTKKNETRTNGRRAERSCVRGGRSSGTRSRWWVVMTRRSLVHSNFARPVDRSSGLGVVQMGPNALAAALASAWPGFDRVGVGVQMGPPCIACTVQYSRSLA